MRLTVQDAGVGFDPQGAERLFDAFYTTKSDGMGIGLSVSRSIIESHQRTPLGANRMTVPGPRFSFSIPGSTIRGRGIRRHESASDAARASSTQTRRIS